MKVNLIKNSKLIVCLARFDHSLLSRGPVIQEKVHDFVNRLNHKVYDERINGITFNPQLIKTELHGGACSSIALQIACPLLDYLKQQPSDFPWSFKEYLSDVVKRINKSSNLKRCKIRSVQAAFNTICVNSEKIPDISQQKIKALAAFYDIKVLCSTEECTIKKGEEFEKLFAEKIKNLNQGLYLVRVIQKAENRKKEARGHSTIYINHKEGEFYFDPRFGLYQLKDQRKVFYESIYGSKRQFRLDNIKMHLLSK